VHGGRMIRRLDGERLENILRAFYRTPSTEKGLRGMIRRLRSDSSHSSGEIN